MKKKWTRYFWLKLQFLILWFEQMCLHKILFQIQLTTSKDMQLESCTIAGFNHHFRSNIFNERKRLNLHDIYFVIWFKPKPRFSTTSIMNHLAEFNYQFPVKHIQWKKKLNLQDISFVLWFEPKRRFSTTSIMDHQLLCLTFIK